MKEVERRDKRCVCACAPTTGDEGLQQLLFAQVVVHLHLHHVTAEPPDLLLPLANTERREREGGSGGVRQERDVAMETKKNLLGARRPPREVKRGGEYQ